MCLMLCATLDWQYAELFYEFFYVRCGSSNQIIIKKQQQQHDLKQNLLLQDTYIDRYVSRT